MLPYDQINFDILLDGNRYLTPGGCYDFSLRINHLMLYERSIVGISTVQILLRDYSNPTQDIYAEIPTNLSTPCEVPGSIRLPMITGSWYPIIVINGIDQYRYPQQMPLFFTRPIIATGYFPVYDARVRRSNWTIDEYKVVQIKSVLNRYGFDCSTIGKEVQAPVPKGKGLMDFEKEWASGGHCFVSVLTPRDRTADSRLALPPPWVITESGLSYDSDRPQLVFIENGVDPVALYGEMDRDRIIGFRVVGSEVLFERETGEKLLRFRNECQAHETGKTLQGIGQGIFIGFALYGGWRFLDDFFRK